VKHGNGYPRGELCARSELVSRLEAKQLVGGAEHGSADRTLPLPGSQEFWRCDIDSSAQAMPEESLTRCFASGRPDSHRGSLRKALLFLVGPSTKPGGGRVGKSIPEGPEAMPSQGTQ
jgi:hypothetical protein